MLSKLIRFVTTDIWRMQLGRFPGRKSVLIRLLRIVALTVRGFDEDRCFLRASALTFYFLFSIAPVLALVFGIAKGFGLEQMLEAQIRERFQGQDEMVAQIIQFSQSMLQQAKGGVIAGVGVALLLWTVIRTLSNIENSFNEIWGVRKGRGFGRRVTDYLAILFICPVFLVIPGSITVVATNYLQAASERFTLLGGLGVPLVILLRLTPYLLIWLLFTFVYIFMPNTKVRLVSAAVGGVVAGTIYQVVQWVYVAFQAGATRYGAIYGSFAAVPLFLAWVQMSWLIVLFGAELSFAHQNVETYEFERDCLLISHSFKKVVSLRIAHLIVKRFSSGNGAVGASEIARTLEVPIRLANEILYELTDSGVISEVKGADGKDVWYQPARDPEVLTVKYVVDALEERGSRDIPIAETEEMRRIGASLKAFSDLVEKSPANVPLKSI